MILSVCIWRDGQPEVVAAITAAAPTAKRYREGFYLLALEARETETRPVDVACQRLRLRERLRRGGPLTHQQANTLAAVALTVAPHLSDRQLATAAGVSHHTIAKVRRNMPTAIPAGNRTNKPNTSDSPTAECDNVSVTTALLEERRESRRLRSQATRQPDHSCAVYGSTADNLEPHFLGWRHEVDIDRMFTDGLAWGIVYRRHDISARPAPIIELAAARDTYLAQAV